MRCFTNQSKSQLVTAVLNPQIDSFAKDDLFHLFAKNAMSGNMLKICSIPIEWFQSLPSTFLEARQQDRQIARQRPVVELMHEDLIPCLKYGIR